MWTKICKCILYHCPIIISVLLYTTYSSCIYPCSHATYSSPVGGELASMVRLTMKLVQNRMFEQLVDFDNHLDDIHRDWTNQDINRAIEAQKMED